MWHQNYASQQNIAPYNADAHDALHTSLSFAMRVHPDMGHDPVRGHLLPGQSGLHLFPNPYFRNAAQR